MRYGIVMRLSTLAAVLVACGDDVPTRLTTPDGGTLPKTDECNVAGDCASKSPTVQCNAGVCEDKVWGCIKQPDPRPAATMPTGTLKIGFVDVALSPVTVPVSVKACPLASVDADCDPVLAGVTPTYTPGMGFTVTGLPPSQPFRLKLDPTNPSDFVGMDFYTQRPVRDVTQQEAPLYAFSPAVVDGLSLAFSLPVRQDGGILIVIYHNCEGKFAEGVSTSLPAADTLADSRFLYFTSQNLPNIELTATSVAGVAVGINLPVNRALTIQSKVRDIALPDYNVALLPGRETVVHAYPYAY